MTRTSTFLLAAGTAALFAFAGCGSGTAAAPAATGTSAAPAPTATASKTMTESAMSEAPKPSDAMAAKGSYITYDEYTADMAKVANTRVVLYFFADWCPTCRATNESLTKTGVPDGLTVVKVNYDTATDLKKKYNVTYQHTFVQITEDGTQVAKWSGSATGADILAKTQAV